MKFGFINIGSKQSFNSFLARFSAEGYHFYITFNCAENDGNDGIHDGINGEMHGGISGGISGEIKDIIQMLNACDVIFAAGDKKKFMQLFNLEGEEKQSFVIDTHLYIFFDDFNDIPNAESIIKEHYSRLNITMSVYRIFLEQGKTAQFDSVFDAQKTNITDKFLLSQQKCGDFLDIIIRHRSDLRISSLNKLILENYFNHIYATNFSRLNGLVADLAIKNNIKLKIAESFTGGRLAAALVSVAGASNFLTESLVTYSDKSKIDRLGINPDIIAGHGAISRETAYEMAKSLYKSGCDIAVATTGNAGPTAQKGGGVGKCFIALAALGKVEVKEYEFCGNREEIMESGVSHALFLLYRKLMLSYTMRS